MKKLIIGILVACLYCFPFVYFAMRQDFINGSLIGYLIMIVGTSTLAFFSKYFSNVIPIVIGNIVSLVISFYFLYKMEATLGVSWDGGYFKPLTPYQLLLFVSFLNLIPQYIVIMVANKKAK